MNDSYTPKVSVILPVWNPGPGISRCIESLRKQTLTDIEMVFIDDCGTDDSMDKVRVTAREDLRIRIIENDENIGAGPSRNRGIEAAKGEYLSFVDPDDYVAHDFLEVLYNEACKQGYDIVKGTRICENEDETITRKRENNNLKIRNELKSGKPLYLLFASEHQSAIYKRETIISTNSRYGSSRRAQDTTFLLQICSQAKTFSTADEANYYFCERTNSAMHTLDTYHLEGFLQSTREKVDYVLHNMVDDPWSMEFLGLYFLGAIREGWRYKSIPNAKAAVDNYAQDLQSIWMQVPEREKLTRKAFSLRALQDHCCILPTTPFCYIWENFYPPIRYAKLAEAWVDYYLDTSNERDACMSELRIVLARAKLAVQGFPPSAYSTKERKLGKEILHEQIDRLPLKIRVQLPILTLMSRVALSLPASAKARIKKALHRF